MSSHKRDHVQSQRERDTDGTVATTQKTTSREIIVQKSRAGEISVLACVCVCVCKNDTVSSNEPRPTDTAAGTHTHRHTHHIHTRVVPG